MDASFETEGLCRFSPPLGRGGSTVRRDGKSTEWWLILECDRDIGRYLRSIYRSATHGVRELKEPLWGTHVSVIRGEQPPEIAAWKRLEGCRLTLSYSNQVELYSSYAVVAVRCDAALDYREELGLPRQPAFPLHLTIGNFKPSG